MKTWRNEGTDSLCEALLSLKNQEECYAFLEDVCTLKEISDLAQRLDVARLLNEGLSYAVIGGKTGASSATISRVSRCLEYGAGGYNTVIERLKKENEK